MYLGWIDFICMGPVNLPGAHRKRQNTKWKILAHSGIWTHKFEICSLSYTWTLMKAVLFKLPLYMYFRYKFENDEVERILSCTCTVLWTTYLNIYAVQIAKFWGCFLFQHENTTNILQDQVNLPIPVAFSFKFIYVMYFFPPNILFCLNPPLSTVCSSRERKELLNLTLQCVHFAEFVRDSWYTWYTLKNSSILVL